MLEVKYLLTIIAFVNHIGDLAGVRAVISVGEVGVPDVGAVLGDGTAGGGHQEDAADAETITNKGVE